MSLISIFKNTNNNNSQTLVVGADAFLNDYLVRSYVKEKNFSQMDHISVDCEADGLDELIANLTESSLFSNQKVITVKNPFFLTSKSIKKWDRQIKQLQDIFSHVQELDNVVVLQADYEKIDRRKKISKIIASNFNIVEPKFKPYEIAAITKAIINTEGYQISQTALHLLIERSDQVIDTILSNYLKLKTIAASRKITEKMVNQNVDLSLAQNIFAILESALNNNYQEALIRLRDQLRQGTNPIQLLAVFENQLEFILVVKTLLKRGRLQNQIVKELGVHPYRVKLAAQNRLNILKLKELLMKAIKLDYNYKKGTVQDEKFVELFILSI